MMNTDYDVAIVGSGFGGALLALVARRIGLTVALLERGTHPRFAIGESTSPLMNLLIEQLAHRYDLPRLLPLTTYGAWQRAYPDVVCGLKRGFTYFHHHAGQPYCADPQRRNQLMVAASPNDTVGDTHWLRADVDHFLVREAVALGVDYLGEANLATAAFDSCGGVLAGERGGKPLRIRARFVVDATGPGGFLSRALNLPQGTFADYPLTQTLYSHFTDVRRCDTMPAFQTNETPPYPLDDAALHHVFDGGWMWVLRFNNGVTSAGIAVENWLAKELALSEGQAAWERFLRRFPTVGEQFADARPIRPFNFAPGLAYRAQTAVGPNWALLPSAAAFVDPLFSTGMPLTLLGIERLGRILEEAWDTPHFAARLQQYGDITLAEADWTAQFIAACYAGFKRFPLFSAFAMFYFAAASHAEMARRLDMPARPRQYLAADHVPFTSGLKQCVQTLRRYAASGINNGDEATFAQSVAESIACLNVAGLCEPCKRNWYGVDMNDIIEGAAKLDLTSDEMRRIVATALWAQKQRTNEQATHSN